MASRKMPQNLDAEMNILGIAFLNEYAFSKICEELSYDLFYDERHQKIFNAITELQKKDIPLDITTITEELTKKKSLGSVGGIEYISEIIESVVSSANLDYYIDIVKENALRRNLIDTATNIVTNAYEEENLNTLIDNAERNILNVVKTRNIKDFVPIGEI